MLILPNGTLPPLKSKTGIVRGKSSGHHWLRARSSVINLNTPPLTKARHLFHAAKQNWLGIGPNGQNNAPTNGIDPQTAWAIQAADYFGILEPGFIQGGVQQIASLVGCATVEAYQVMIQLILATLGLPSAPAPTINSSYLATDTLTQNHSVGSYDAILIVPTMPPPDPLSFIVRLSIEIAGNNTTAWTAAASTPPTGITPTLSATTFSLIHNPIDDTSTGTVYLTFTLAPNTTPETGTVTATLTGPGGTTTFDIDLAVTTGNIVSALPPPTYPLPTGMSSTTVYDSSYNLLGFQLTYSAADPFTYPMSRFGAEIPGLWLITASDAYSSSYARPGVATWAPILASGPYMPTPTDLLAAWQDTFGDVPDAGSIGFQAQYVDPPTGCPGPPLSCTARWKNGTLQGAKLSDWTGPQFNLYNLSGSGNVTAGTTVTLQITIQGANGYGGTITLSVKPKSSVNTGTPSTTHALPPGVVFTLSQDTLTIPPGDTTIYTITATAPLPATLAPYNFTVELAATDGIQSSGGSSTMQVMGGTDALPPQNFLSIDPDSQTAPIASPGTATFTFTLYNQGSEDLIAVPIAYNPDNDLTLAWDAPSYDVPAGSVAAPGTTTMTLTVTAPTSLTQPLPQFQIEAYSGLNSCYCIVTLTPA